MDALQVLKRWGSIDPRCPFSTRPRHLVEDDFLHKKPSQLLPSGSPASPRSTSSNSSQAVTSGPLPTNDTQATDTPPTALPATVDESAVPPVTTLADQLRQTYLPFVFQKHCTRAFDRSTYRAAVTAELSVAKPVSRQGPSKEAGLSKLRSVVSQSKVRFREDGFDLDLTYITPRIVAMGFPSSGRESYFRNPIGEVERFFNERHEGHYRIYNLCSEREYEASRFGGRFKRFPFDDHQAPCPVKLIPDMCRDAQAFMKQDDRNVVAIHCKAGKGRTGLMVTCLLMITMPTLRCPDDALQFFGEARTNDGKGVTIPSQMRYVRYWDSMLKEHNGREPSARTLVLRALRVHGPIRLSGMCDHYFLIFENNVERFDSRKLVKARTAWRQELAQFVYDFFSTVAPQQLVSSLAFTGDLRFEFYEKKMISDEALFHFWINTSLCPLQEIILKGDLDKIFKDTKNQIATQELAIQLEWTPYDTLTASSRSRATSGGAAEGIFSTLFKQKK